MRHGQSAGNVARDDAERRGLHSIDIQGRDMDVPLSELGRQQARSVGAWFRGQRDEQRFGIVLCSPYARARETAELVCASSQSEAQLVIDERLREKEFGGLDRLTKAGIEAAFPGEAERRALVGKFYYRPPGGESWCDVILRLRSVLDHIQLRYSGERVLLVAHQVIVLGFRYLLEDLDEQAILDIDRQGDVANASLTSFEPRVDEASRERMVLCEYNFVAPLQEAGTQVTREADASVKK
jgi:broad specificity phosphatase PhoE